MGESRVRFSQLQIEQRDVVVYRRVVRSDGELHLVADGFLGRRLRPEITLEPTPIGFGAGHHLDPDVGHFI